jgi:hypothetical protein
MVWILIRVIPKPSRLSYPCVRTAMPLASGFIGYLIMVVLSGVAFLRSKKSIRYYPVFFLCAFIVFGISGAYLVENTTEQQFNTAVLTPNAPIGEAKGIFPGRVVWVHNPRATNENCSPGTYGDGWFLLKNNDTTVVDSMVSEAVQTLTGQTTDIAAWNAIFQYHNTTRGKGAVNYSPGEKIFIKINATSAWSGNYNTTDLSKINNSSYGISETSPAMVLAVLRQLVNVVGVAQTNIYVGDPMKHIYKHCYDLWHGEFPNVVYLDYDHTNLGRTKVVASTTAMIHYADHGTILRENVWDASRPGTTPVYNDHLYTVVDNAEYMINIPQLKGHQRAGMTLFAKNHFGSQTGADASHLHNGLVAPRQDTTLSYRKGYGLYRAQVDIMSHSMLGKKNLMYLMDALWATDYEADVPLKWHMAPFNNDYCSSVFASLDPVAIESVGYDFLRSEFTVARGGCYTVVQMDGVDDYLHQAADSLNWPSGIKYDPDSNGVHIKSLGTHEHWNNATDMKYTRNLGTGNGIELISKYDPPFPVQLVSFNVTLKEARIILSWKTATEVNNYGLESERRIVSKQISMGANESIQLLNGLSAQWQKIGFISGNGTSNSPHMYTYYDANLTSGRYAYRLKQIDNSGAYKYSQSVELEIASAPAIFGLRQNYPNPFNPSTKISFSIANTEHAVLSVYNLLGQQVEVLFDGIAEGQKNYEVKFDAGGLSSGVYFYKLITPTQTDVRRMMLMK